MAARVQAPGVETSSRGADAADLSRGGYVHGTVGVGLTRTRFLPAKTVDQAHELKFYQPVGRSDPAAIHVLTQSGLGFH
jgi:hypothetical protein